MNAVLTIKSAMHPLPHTIGEDQTLLTARSMLDKYGIRHLPVCNGGKLCGILSDRDIDFALRFDGLPSDKILVKDCFTANPYAVEANTPLYEVADRMARDHIGCTVVVNHERPIGIFTTVDACRVLAERLRADSTT